MLAGPIDRSDIMIVISLLTFQSGTLRIDGEESEFLNGAPMTLNVTYVRANPIDYIDGVDHSMVH